MGLLKICFTHLKAQSQKNVMVDIVFDFYGHGYRPVRDKKARTEKQYVVGKEKS